MRGNLPVKRKIASRENGKTQIFARRCSLRRVRRVAAAATSGQFNAIPAKPGPAQLLRLRVPAAFTRRAGLQWLGVVGHGCYGRWQAKPLATSPLPHLHGEEVKWPTIGRIIIRENAPIPMVNLIGRNEMARWPVDRRWRLRQTQPGKRLERVFYLFRSFSMLSK